MAMRFIVSCLCLVKNIIIRFLPAILCFLYNNEKKKKLPSFPLSHPQCIVWISFELIFQVLLGKLLNSTPPLQLLDLNDSKEAVYGTLDGWVAWEQDFPIGKLRMALIALEKEQQWHRIIQV